MDTIVIRILGRNHPWRNDKVLHRSAAGPIDCGMKSPIMRLCDSIYPFYFKKFIIYWTKDQRLGKAQNSKFC